jgi:hypothetical protein
MALFLIISKFFVLHFVFYITFIAFDSTPRSMKNPLFITTPKNGDPPFMSIHEIEHENGNVHFGKVLVPKVAFENGNVHVVKVFINVAKLPIFTPIKKRQENQCGSLTKCIMIIGQDDNG